MARMYTIIEDQKILRYIMNGNHGRSTKGHALWKKMEEEDIVPGRTWQSLRNRWLKYISLDLNKPEYGLTNEERTELKSEIGLNGKTIEGKMKINKKEESDQEIDSDETDESKLPDSPLKKKKQFLTLDMNWSDDDTE